MNEQEAFRAILGRSPTKRKQDKKYLAFYYAGKITGVREAGIERQAAFEEIIEHIETLKENYGTISTLHNE